MAVFHSFGIEFVAIQILNKAAITGQRTSDEALSTFVGIPDTPGPLLLSRLNKSLATISLVVG